MNTLSNAKNKISFLSKTTNFWLRNWNKPKLKQKDSAKSMSLHLKTKTQNFKEKSKSSTKNNTL